MGHHVDGRSQRGQLVSFTSVSASPGVQTGQDYGSRGDPAGLTWQNSPKVGKGSLARSPRCWCQQDGRRHQRTAQLVDLWGFVESAELRGSASAFCFHLISRLHRFLPQHFQKDLRLGSWFEKGLSQPFLETIWVEKRKLGGRAWCPPLLPETGWRVMKGTGTARVSVLFCCGCPEPTLTGVRLEVRTALLFFGQNPRGGWVCTWQMSLASMTHLQTRPLCPPG